jgi:hypothetical protein
VLCPPLELPVQVNVPVPLLELPGPASTSSHALTVTLPACRTGVTCSPAPNATGQLAPPCPAAIRRL